MSTFLNPVPCAWPARQGLEPHVLIPNLQTENERDVSQPARHPAARTITGRSGPEPPPPGCGAGWPAAVAVSTPPGRQRDPSTGPTSKTAA